MCPTQPRPVARWSMLRAAAVVALTGPGGAFVGLLVRDRRRARLPRTGPVTTSTVVVRAVSSGAVGLGVVGAAVGLVIGLFADVWTAPVAAIELGLPATVAGALIGLVAGTTYVSIRFLARGRRS